MSIFNNISRRKFIYGSTCFCASSLVLPSCTEVALSERQQFNILSDDFLYSKTFPAYNNFKSQSKLITGTSEYNEIVDHRYVFANMGYNLKPLDLQGAMGVVQLEKFDEIHERRRNSKKKLEIK